MFLILRVSRYACHLPRFGAVFIEYCLISSHGLAFQGGSLILHGLARSKEVGLGRLLHMVLLVLEWSSGHCAWGWFVDMGSPPGQGVQRV